MKSSEVRIISNLGTASVSEM